MKKRSISKALTHGNEPTLLQLMSIGPGAVVGKIFKIVSIIGEGGMGTVYHTEHATLNKAFALKVLSPEIINEQSWLRFQAEAKTLAALNHNSFVKVYDLGVHNGSVPFYSMDLLQGQNLEALLAEEGPQSLRKTLQIFLPLIDGMIYAHSHGIIHRDLKPANIFLCTTNTPEQVNIKILDFGIVKLLAGNDQTQNLTAVGEVFGSPYYMSPEQCTGQTVDGRSDIYSIGCTLFETLTGFVPFEGETAMDIAIMHYEATPPLISDVLTNKILPPSIDIVIQKCLAKKPEDRYQSASELHADLSRIADGKSIDTKMPDRELGKAKFSLVGSEKLLIPTALLLLCLSIATGAQHLSKTAEKAGTTAKSHSETTGGELDLAADLDGSTLNLNDIDPDLKIAAESFLRNRKRKYSQLVQINGITQKQFDFPASFSLGKLSTGSPTTQRICQAQGLVTVMPSEEIHLEANYILGTYPELLKHFQDTDLTSFSIKGGFRNGDSLVANLEGSKTLNALFLHDLVLSEKGVASLSKLKDLKRFALVNANVDGAEIAKMPFIKYVQTLTIGGVPNISPLLDLLSSSEKITNLRFENIDFTSTELEKLSKLKALDRLTIRSNSFTSADLEKLTSLAALIYLNVADCEKLDQESVASMQKFKKLEVLRLPFQLATTQIETRLHRSLPKLKTLE